MFLLLSLAQVQLPKLQLYHNYNSRIPFSGNFFVLRAGKKRKRKRKKEEKGRKRKKGKKGKEKEKEGMLRVL